MSQFVLVGVIVGPFSVRGEVRLKSFTACPESIGAYGGLTTEDGQRHFEIQITRRLKGGLAARVAGVESRAAAEALKGVRLFVPRARLPALPPDEFYHADLIGLAVRDMGGMLVGHIKAVQENGAGDLLEVQAGGDSVLVPFTRAVVPKVDMEARCIVVDAPPGLFGR